MAIPVYSFSFLCALLLKNNAYTAEIASMFFVIIFIYINNPPQLSIRQYFFFLSFLTIFPFHFCHILFCIMVPSTVSGPSVTFSSSSLIFPALLVDHSYCSVIFGIWSETENPRISRRVLVDYGLSSTYSLCE